MAWANANGIVTGYSQTAFGHGDPITREQMAAILYRYCGYRGIDVSAEEGTNLLSYSDGASVSTWAASAMRWACGAGVIQGMPGNLLIPRGGANRAQAATMIMRFYTTTVE